jgi:hypothetical protein
MLNTLCRQFLSLMLRRARAAARGGDEKPEAAKTLILSVFLASQKNLRVTLRNRIVRGVMRVSRAGRDARCGIGAHATALDPAKTLVFLLRCSNRKGSVRDPRGHCTTSPLTHG